MVPLPSNSNTCRLQDKYDGVSEIAGDMVRQVVQRYKTGELELTEVPHSALRSDMITVQTAVSLVSAGTERYMIDLAKKSLAGKALARPDLVKRVIDKARAEGIAEAYRQAMGRLDTPVPLGYSSAGIVVDVGRDVEGFAIGDRVACAGSGYAGHAETTAVPATLCTRIPDNVTFESAAFVALGGIALEAVRMAQVGLGETVVVIGLGLLGQIAIQLFDAAGCHVIGIDLDTQKTSMARDNGAEAVATDYQSLASLCAQRTNNHGADAVIIMAATSSNEPLEQAADLCRERGRVVATGLIGLEIPRTPFYDKELELVVSRAWGPGIYDSNYTDKNLDYPVAYARWTAKRNMQEFLTQMARGAVTVDHLITHRFPFERALDAYELILEGDEPYIGVLLEYPEADGTQPDATVVWLNQSGRHPVSAVSGEAIGIGLIGAGQYANGTLLPAIQDLNGLRFRGVATATGLSGRHTGDKFNFDYCTTEYHKLLDDDDVDLVFVLTRHGSHAHFVTDALEAGKHVFVEKPLALNKEQLRAVIDAYQMQRRDNGRHRLLAVGFNRRFSPFTRWVKDRVSTVAGPLAVHCTINAGPVPPDHWVHDPEQGGGRIVGEVCHFIDLIQCLTGSVPLRVHAETLDAAGYTRSDNVVVTLKMVNGAVGSITYVAGGDRRHPRERIEVFGGGTVGVIDNFKTASFTQGGRTDRHRNWLSADRGHRGEIEAVLEALRRGSTPPVPFVEYVYTTLATFAIEDSLRTGQAVTINPQSLFPDDVGEDTERDVESEQESAVTNRHNSGSDD